MGLDMYLTARTYVSDYAYQNGENSAAVDSILGAVGIDRTLLSPDSPGIEVAVTVGYWRKANAIHAWFVKNVQGGVDQCQEAYVTRAQLMDLLQMVDYALKKKDPSGLPTESGFFFGGTDVDDWYWDSLKHTKKMLKGILTAPSLNLADFYYQSSW
jgi:hypothetical protein